MIICHCNRISDADLRGAVACLKSRCPAADVCARRVYGELGKCPKCCNCLTLAEKTVSQIDAEYVGEALHAVPPGNTPFPLAG